MIDRMVRQEIGRLLDNWALCNGRFSGAPVTSNGAGWERVGSGAAREHAAEVPVPYIVADAQRVDRALKHMIEHEREILVESYCIAGTQESNAKVRKMALRTYERWLSKAEQTFWDAYRYKSLALLVQPPVPAHIAEPVEASIKPPKQRRKRASILPAAQALARDSGQMKKN
jgi:hypothetical protein